MSSKRKLVALYFSVSDIEKKRIEDALSLQKMRHPNLDRSDFLRELVFAALDAQTQTLGARNTNTRRAIDQLTEQLNTLMVLSIAALRSLHADSARPPAEFVQLLQWAKQHQALVIKTVNQLAESDRVTPVVETRAQKKPTVGGQP